MKRFVSLAVVLLMLLCLSSGAFAALADTYIDNSDLIPPYRPHDKVDVEQSGELWSPDWVDELIMAAVRIETCTEEGTFQAAVKMLDHYQEMGVNGLWVLPIYDRADGKDSKHINSAYCNYGPETVWWSLTGTTDYEEGFKVVKQFVDEAHRRNIRILFDVVVWGVVDEAPVFKQHPEYFNGGQAYGGHTFNCSNTGFREWYTKACVDLIRKTGADGLRCDLEPSVSGYSLFQGIRDELYYTHGIKIAVMSEFENDRGGAYDLEQVSLFGNAFIDAAEGDYVQIISGVANPVKDESMSPAQMIKSGKYIGSEVGEGAYRYYTYNLLNHDHSQRTVKGSRIRFGWQAVFTPFIPLWYIGEEWDDPVNIASGGSSGALAFDRIDWSQLDDPENRAFFEDIKRYIRIRRTYPEIFQYFPNDSRDANICDVDVSGGMSELAAYARYMGERAVIVVPNDDIAKATLKVTIPYAQMGMGKKGGDVYTVTDLLTGKQIAKGTAKELKNFKGTVESDAIGVYLVEGPQVSKPTTDKPTTGKPTTNSTKQPTDTTTAVPSATEPSTEEQGTTTEANASSTATAAPTTVTQADSVADNVDGGLPLGAVLGIAGGAIVLAVAVIVLLVLKKKKS